MIPDDTLGKIHKVLDGQGISAMTMHAYESVTVRDNAFCEESRSFIGKFLNVSGNQFPNSAGESIEVYMLGLSGIFLGGQALEPTAIIEQILSRIGQAADLLEIV